jgi:hypothetical protein
MKLSVFGSLLVLMLFSVVVPTVNARSQNTSPFNLAYLARQGYFQAQGIPSHSALCAAVMAKRVRAKDIVIAAIAHNRLSSEILNDEGYLKRLEVMLRRSCQRI